MTNNIKNLAYLVILSFLPLKIVGQDKSVTNFFPKSGNVGIGILNPLHELEVKGVVRSEEVLVESYPWPDFVFEAGYALPDLRDVERYIDENGHLEYIPSAAVVEKNGIAVGEMSARLLQKIEEMTLYLIEQNKQIEALEKEVAALKGLRQDPNIPINQ